MRKRSDKGLDRLMGSELSHELDEGNLHEIDDLTEQQVRLLSERSVRAEKAGEMEKADRLAARAEALRNRAKKK